MMIFGIPHEFVVSDIKNLAVDLRCSLGIHEMFDWTPATAWDPDAHPCRYLRNCIHCGNVVEEDFRHTWLEWEQVPENPCLQVRKCAFCHETERREDHECIDWYPESQSYSNVNSTCNRCGAVVHRQDLSPSTAMFYKYVNLVQNNMLTTLDKLNKSEADFKRFFEEYEEKQRAKNLCESAWAEKQQSHVD